MCYIPRTFHPLTHMYLPTNGFSGEQPLEGIIDLCFSISTIMNNDYHLIKPLKLASIYLSMYYKLHIFLSSPRSH